MTRFLFVLPLLLSIAWLVYLRLNGWTLRQGLRGFTYIAIVSSSIALIYTLLWWLTN